MGLGPLGIPSLLLLAHPCDSVQAFLGSWVELAPLGELGDLVAIGTKVNSGLGVSVLLPASPGYSGTRSAKRILLIGAYPDKASFSWSDIFFSKPVS